MNSDRVMTMTRHRCRASFRQYTKAADQVAAEAAFDRQPNPEYVVPNWPQLSAGRKWYEVTQDRDVPLALAGRETIVAWKAKIYVAIP